MTDLKQRRVPAIVVSECNGTVDQGIAFYIKDYIEFTALNKVVEILIVSNGKSPHIKWKVSAIAEFTLEVYRGPVVTDNGTAITVTNYNDVCGKSATVEAYSAPSVADYGILTGKTKIGGGIAVTSSYSTYESTNEFLWEKNSNYILRFTKNVSGSHYLDFQISWYEK